MAPVNSLPEDLKTGYFWKPIPATASYRPEQTEFALYRSYFVDNQYRRERVPGGPVYVQTAEGYRQRV